MTNPYDRVRYPSQPAGQTHPAVLGVFAALFGRPFAPFGASRVLDIGCGEGVNLLNMAICAPNSEFVGIDLATGPIDAAQKSVRALGLANTHFHVQDIAAMDGSLGRFDYIIAHGVYAWVPPSVGEALMQVIGQSLSDDGLAFISYNAHPGARFRQVLRDLLLGAADAVADPADKLSIARSILTQAAEGWSETDPFQNAMKAAARDMLERPSEVLFHDELGACFEPRLLSSVIAAARRVGLDYLCDTQADLSAEAFFPSEKFAAAQDYTRGDWGRFEQLSDFSEMRFFRNSILCRDGRIDRRFDPQRLRDLWAYGDLTPQPSDPENPDEFAFVNDKGAKMTTNSPKLIELVARIGAAFPSCIPLNDAAEDEELAAFVMRLFVARLVGLRAAPYSLTTTPGDRPVASPLARLQASRGERSLTSLRHLSIQVEDKLTRDLIALMDGAHAREDFAREFETRANLSAEEAAARTATLIAGMTKLGLLAA